jgi:hypothetical protein
MSFKSIVPKWGSDVRPACPKCERAMQLTWIATEQDPTFTFECSACNVEYEISELYPDAQPWAAQIAH